MFKNLFFRTFSYSLNEVILLKRPIIHRLAMISNLIILPGPINETALGQNVTFPESEMFVCSVTVA